MGDEFENDNRDDRKLATMPVCKIWPLGMSSRVTTVATLGNTGNSFMSTSNLKTLS